MAEYIDREEVLELKEDYGEGQYLMILIDPVLVKRLPTADVIERDKVKSLIEVAIEDGWELDYALERLKEM